MRVIGGIYKSRIIKNVKSKNTRPTTDKNKESLFNMLGQFFSNGVMLDLFAGSGSIGIEAISRGIESVDFVDDSIQATKIIKENLKTLKINNSKIFKSDVFSYLNKTNKEYDLIFADPPYNLNKYDILLDIINSRQLCRKNGIIILEADKIQIFKVKIGSLLKYKEKTLGNTKFAFYRMGDQL